MCAVQVVRYCFETWPTCPIASAPCVLTFKNCCCTNFELDRFKNTKICSTYMYPLNLLLLYITYNNLNLILPNST